MPFRAGSSSTPGPGGQPMSPHGGGMPSTDNVVSLIPYLRRLVVTGMDFPGLFIHTDFNNFFLLLMVPLSQFIIL